MDVVPWYPHSAHLALREYVRGLEPEYSLLWGWQDRPAPWREGLQDKLTELLGLPAQRCPLDPRELECTDCDGYSRTRLTYNVEAGVGATAWLCVPHDARSPLPAVICAHPRGAGKDELVGLVGEGPHSAFAAELARKGYVTLAPDARCHGERGDDEACLGAVGLVLGRPLVGMRVWDLLRAVDYLAQRADVKASRIGVTGRGMGAGDALFAAALDARIACTALCGGLSTVRELIVARDGFRTGGPPPDLVPGLLRVADLNDVACLIAPRPLIMVQGRSDATVPARGAEECLARVRAGYELQGEKVKVETMVAEGGDTYYAEPLYRFLDDWLGLPDRV